VLGRDAQRIFQAPAAELASLVHVDTGHVRGLPRRDIQQSAMAACGVNTTDPLTTGLAGGCPQ